MLLGMECFVEEFFIVPTKYDVVLGLPFVQKNSSLFNWKLLSISLCDALPVEEFFDNETEQYLLVEIEDQNREVNDANIKLLIDDHKEVFAEKLTETVISRREDDTSLTLIPGYKTPDTRSYPLSPILKDVLRTQIERLRKAGIIEESYSPFNTPIWMVKKKDGTFRMCLDYRLVNLLLIKKRFHLPTIREIIQKISRAKYFSTLDLTESFYQLKLDKDSREVTAFTVDGIKYQFTSLPFGLVNSPAELQLFLQKVLKGIPNVINYVDDILIGTVTYEEHVEVLRKVFQALRKHRLKVKLSKCSLLQKELIYLGYAISEKGSLFDLYP